jgi:hypothetical protein
LYRSELEREDVTEQNIDQLESLNSDLKEKHTTATMRLKHQLPVSKSMAKSQESQETDEERRKQESQFTPFEKPGRVYTKV